MMKMVPRLLLLLVVVVMMVMVVMVVVVLQLGGDLNFKTTTILQETTKRHHAAPLDLFEDIIASLVLFPSSSSLVSSSSSDDDDADDDSNDDNQVILVFDVTMYGAIGDGNTDDTLAIRSTLSKAADEAQQAQAEKQKQQQQEEEKRKYNNVKEEISTTTFVSVVYFPKNKIFVTGPLNISSNIILHIDGTIQAITNTTIGFDTKWPLLPPLPNYGTSEDDNTYADLYSSSTRSNNSNSSSSTNNTSRPRPLIKNDDDDEEEKWLQYRYLQYQSFIYAAHATNIIIRGTGIIDGMGSWWWDIHQHHYSGKNIVGNKGGRPNLIQFLNCSFIEISGVTLLNSPFWTIHPVLSQNIWIHHIMIRSPLYAPNVDGIDPDSCKDVVIEHNDISCGDDHIAIKSGRCGPARGINNNNLLNEMPSCSQDIHFMNGDYITQNITIRYNTFRTGMGIALGSELSGGISDVNVYQNIIGLCEHGHTNYNKSCGWGVAIHLKTTLTRSGFLRNIKFHSNIIYNTTSFFVIETDYQDKSHKVPPNDYPVTEIRNITIDNNSGLGLARNMNFGCNKYMICQDIFVRNNWISNTPNNNDDDNNIYHCSYVDKYNVSGNDPPGLDECMLHSMNRTQQYQQKAIPPSMT